MLNSALLISLWIAVPASASKPSASATAQDGSLWDFIEAPTSPSDSDAHDAVVSRAASLELRAAKARESTYFNRSVRLADPPIEFYTDPVAHLAADPLHLNEIDPSEFDIPVVVNDSVVRWMEYFTGSGRAWYGKWLARSGRYWPMMHEKLDQAGLPRDLVFLSMIESGYATHAYSSAAAVGLWQFMPATGKGYDLRVDWWVDERRDPELATDAAIEYLGDLHKRYGHWYLAWSAYNAGPSRVSRGIRKHGTKDFWTLSRKGSFRSETDNYVPKLLAAAIIGKHPDRYGFGDVKKQDPMDHETITVSANVGIDVLARCANVTVDEFRGLNPQLRRWALPPSPARQLVHVPSGQSKKFLAALDRIPSDQRITHRRHTVKRGETLGTVAKKYGVSARVIQTVNKIRNVNRISVGQNLVIPVAGDAAGARSLTASTGGAPASKRPQTHKIKSGQTLSGIAKKYGVRLSDLKRWNGVQNANRIRPGQKLKLYGTAPGPKWSSYTVRRGDTLSGIARRHGCSTTQLRKWNKIKGSRIMAGQKLKVQK
jgi:membrane-bound lytic murein transglycosylase D